GDGEVEAVVQLDVACDFLFAGQHRGDLQLTAVQGAHLVQRHDFEGVDHGQPQVVLFPVVGQREHGTAPWQRVRHSANGFDVHHHVAQVHAALAGIDAERIAHDGVGNKTQVDQNGAKRLAVNLLLAQTDAQLVLGNGALFEQQRAKALAYG